MFGGEEDQRRPLIPWDQLTSGAPPATAEMFTCQRRCIGSGEGFRVCRITRGRVKGRMKDAGNSLTFGLSSGWWKRAHLGIRCARHGAPQLPSA